MSLSLIIDGEHYTIIQKEYGNCPECQNAWIDYHRQLGDPDKPKLTFLLEYIYNSNYEPDYMEYCPRCGQFWD